MRLVKLNIETIQSGTLFITVNRFVKSNGCSVMGRGTAKWLLEKFSGIDKDLGLAISNNVHVGILKRTANLDYGYFVVKPDYGSSQNIIPRLAKNFNLSQQIPGWAVFADIKKIELSLNQLSFLYRCNSLRLPIYLPLPGCGAGELNKEDVIKLLNDRVSYIDDLIVFEKEYINYP
jgi:hypothetical protein